MTDMNSTYQKWKEDNLQGRITDWHEEGEHVKKLLLDYDWEYRKKICSKCSVETRKKLKCFKVDNFKDGVQETHCKKMEKARTQKHRKTILNFINFHPLGKSIQHF